jgi:cytochrome P450
VTDLATGPVFTDHYWREPFAVLGEVRDQAPVREVELPEGGTTWLVTRYADARAVMADPRFVKDFRNSLPEDQRANVPGIPSPGGDMMLLNDPPVHTRLRKLVQQAFTPRALARIASTVERGVGACLDAIAQEDEFDLVAGLALPVPSIVICEMMGVPAADRARFTAWTADATHDLQLMPDPAIARRADEASFALRDYFHHLVEERRANLTDDILSGLIRAEQDGGTLAHGELISQAIGLLIAGFETTIGAISLGVRSLLRHPEQLARLRAHPELIKPAVEECLRFDTSIPVTSRILHADAVFGGVTLPADTPVLALVAAAQRDPAVYTDPDTFDIGRDEAPVLAFGGGIHHCLGAHLARMELQTSILGLVQRFPGLELVTEELTWGRSLFRVPSFLRLRRGRG